MKKLINHGFTVIELLIASMVFTTVLLLCMEGITRIAKVYVKNASITKTNEFVKSFTSDLSQQIKYGSTTPLITYPATATSPWYLCFSGNAYKITRNLKDAGAVKKIKIDSCASATNPYNVDATYNTADSVAPPNMRVLAFSISEVSTALGTKTWSIYMRVALGDSDLLVDRNGVDLTNATADFQNASCKSSINGSEFCAVIPLTTVVSRRMVGI